ncbi:MAG: hypothetical protein AB7S77_13550 [Desulfatirhabdiaceae bacterium]
MAGKASTPGTLTGKGAVRMPRGVELLRNVLDGIHDMCYPKSWAG